MANGDQESNARVGKAKDELVAAQAHLEAVQAAFELEQANTKAEQAKKEAEEAKGTPDQEAKENAAREAGALLAQAKDKAEKAKAGEEQAKEKVEQANKKEEGKGKGDLSGSHQSLKPGSYTPPLGLQFVAHTGGIVLKGGLGAVAIVFLLTIAWQISPWGNLFSLLRSPDIVRGFITFLIALGTIAIAIMLVIAAFSPNGDTPLKERFDMGKGVLTALIGILGTIVGFYFGAAEKTIIAPTTSAGQVIQAGEAAIKDLKPGESTEFTLTIKEGEPPYSYTITFPAETNIPAIKAENIQDKQIKATIKIPEGTKPGLEFAPTIDIKDRNNKPVKFEGKMQKIRVTEKTETKT
jgi:hypothetical protein